MTDAIIGLPMLSFLLIPTMSSYSTSLNLLFFYLTWSTLVLSHPPLKVEIIASLAVRLLFYVFPSLFFLAFDAFVPSAAENFKALGDSALPLKNASRKRTIALLRMVGWSIFNTLLGLTIQAGVEIVFTRVLLWRSALRVTTTLPLPWGIIKDLAKGYLLREIIAYTLHRCVLHNWNHTVSLSRSHRDWYHAIDAPFPLSATYDHPLAYLVRSFLPMYLPALILRFHLLTYIFYLTLTSLEETFAYSGYSTMPTNFILGGMARRTDNHVLCDGEGNFGPWGLCDWIMGTSVGADLVDDVVAEADKHDVPGKVEKAKGRVRKGVSQEANGMKGAMKRRTRRRADD
ncbi:Sterol desaturase family [Cladophialophora carrionii]|uniref:Sterol desaturase family n=1 Tax=Cladophialophora carrionii TaxID=86049 RepID=A0A1C1CNX6_9EURO|nr:Sterol desaturase family [Cladophialophora carrionii]